MVILPLLSVLKIVQVAIVFIANSKEAVFYLTHSLPAVDCLG
jgi:hypothetical protein